MQIVMPNGRTIALQPQTPVDLGRAHYGITLKAPFVARYAASNVRISKYACRYNRHTSYNTHRQQCTATLRHDGTVEVISIARHNPTLVLCHTQANAQRVLLKQGMHIGWGCVWNDGVVPEVYGWQPIITAR